MTRLDGTRVKLSTSDRVAIGLFGLAQLIVFAVGMHSLAAKVEVMEANDVHQSIQIKEVKDDIRQLSADLRNRDR